MVPDLRLPLGLGTVREILDLVLPPDLGGFPLLKWDTPPRRICRVRLFRCMADSKTTRQNGNGTGITVKLLF